MNKFGALRVSTIMQDLDRQKYILEKYNIPKENIIELKLSGSNSAKTIIKLLQEKNMQAGDELHIEALDRLSRDTIQMIQTVQWLASHKIKLFIRGEELKVDTLEGETELNTQAFIASLYRTKLKYQTKDGIAAKKALGTYTGGRPKINNKKIDAIVKLYQQGFRISDIEKSLDISRPTIIKYLKERNIIEKEQCK